MPPADHPSSAAKAPAPLIYVLAGTNGAGKSSIGGEMIRSLPDGDYFNPDERTQEILSENPSVGIDAANGQAWQEGRQALENAIEKRRSHAFETTLGGNSIVSLLELAAAQGFEVMIWFAGLNTPELHLERVRLRVAKGGHDISEKKIRERYDQSRKNLIRLLPSLTGLRVYDNSKPSEPPAAAPEPKLLLHFERGRVIVPEDLAGTPEWAREIVAAALALADVSPP